MGEKEDFLGNTTQIDTEGLWLCGASFFPSMAVSHANAAQGLGDSAGTDSWAFTRQRSLSHPPYTADGAGPIYPAWVACRDAFQAALRESVQNLYATGDALERIAWAADDADGQHAQLLARVQGYLNSDAADTDDGVPIWTDGDRPVPETPEESTQRREAEPGPHPPGMPPAP